MIDKRLVLHKLRGEHNYNQSSGICGVCGKKEIKPKEMLFDRFSNSLTVPDELVSLERITEKCGQLWTEANVKPTFLRVSAKGAHILNREMSSQMQYTQQSDFAGTGTIVNTPFNQMVIELIR